MSSAAECRHLLTLDDLSADEVVALVERARAVKERPARTMRALYERTLLMIFEAPSLRTRLSFETAMTQLHGHAINYYTVHSPWGVGKESIEDFARTVSRYCDAVSARVFSHADLVQFAASSSVPVVNAMTDLGHPCQILGDLVTVDERLGRIRDFRIGYAGDARNNVTYSWMRAAAKLGFELRIACPDDEAFRPDAALRERIGEGAGRIIVTSDLAVALDDVDVVYTDSWMSYRVPAAEREARGEALAAFRIDGAAMGRAAAGAVFMHCLPAQRGMEVTAEVIDGPRSIVFDQAENRLHSEKAILLDLLDGPESGVFR